MTIIDMGTIVSQEREGGVPLGPPGPHAQLGLLCKDIHHSLHKYSLESGRPRTGNPRK